MGMIDGVTLCLHQILPEREYWPLSVDDALSGGFLRYLREMGRRLEQSLSSGLKSDTARNMQTASVPNASINGQQGTEESGDAGYNCLIFAL